MAVSNLGKPTLIFNPSSNQSIQPKINPATGKPVDVMTGQSIQPKYFGGSSGAGISSATGVGGVSAAQPSQPASKPIVQYAGGSYNPNTGVFTDIRGNKSSTSNPEALNQQVIRKQEQEKLAAYSKTGGKKTVQDSGIVGAVISAGQTGVRSVQTSVETLFPSVKGGKYSAEELREGFRGVNPALSAEEQRRQVIANIERSRALTTGVSLATPAVFKGAGIAFKAVGKAVSPIFQPILQTGERLTTPIVESPVARAAVTTAEKVVSQASQGFTKGTGGFVTPTLQREVVKGGARVGLGESIGFGGEQLPSGVEKISRGSLQTGSEAERKAISKAIQSTNVSYFGGTEISAEGTKKEVKGKAEILEQAGAFFASGLVKNVSEGYAKELDSNIRENVKDLSEYKKLNSAEKEQYIQQVKNNIAAVNYSQLPAEIANEVRSELIGQTTVKGLSPLAWGRLSTIAVFAAGVAPAGGLEGRGSTKIQAKSEFREATGEEKTTGTIFGAGISGGFGAAQGATIGKQGLAPKAVRAVGLAVDAPQEPVGDILAGAIMKRTGLQSGIKLPSKIFTFTPSKSTIEKTDVSITGVKSAVGVKPSVNVGAVTSVESKSEEKEKGKPKPSIIVGGISPSVPSRTDTGVPEPAFEKTEEPPEKTVTEEKTEVPAFTDSRIQTNVNVITANRLPFLPLVGPMGSGQVGKRGGRLRFSSELSQASSALFGPAGFGRTGPLIRVKQSKSIYSKRRRK